LKDINIRTDSLKINNENLFRTRKHLTNNIKFINNDLNKILSEKKMSQETKLKFSDQKIIDRLSK